MVSSFTPPPLKSRPVALEPVTFNCQSPSDDDETYSYSGIDDSTYSNAEMTEIKLCLLQPSSPGTAAPATPQSSSQPRRQSDSAKTGSAESDRPNSTARLCGDKGKSPVANAKQPFRQCDSADYRDAGSDSSTSVADTPATGHEGVLCVGSHEEEAPSDTDGAGSDNPTSVANLPTIGHEGVMSVNGHKAEAPSDADDAQTQSGGEKSAAETCRRQGLSCRDIVFSILDARKLRDLATSQSDLDRVEQLCRKAAKVAAHMPDDNGIFTVEQLTNLESEALQLLGLLLCQEGRDEEARHLLRDQGFKYRLSPEVFRYNCDSSNAAQVPLIEKPPPAPSTYVQAVDGVLPRAMLLQMQSAFSIDAPFWAEHDYKPGKSQYFSYVHELQGPETSFLDQVIRLLHRTAVAHFPQAALARRAEWWAHHRSHTMGHQLHCDSDNEGLNTVRNPIVSTVVYLDAEVGGPTLVTEQGFNMAVLGRWGWAVQPKENRYVMFRGDLLHCVVPGCGLVPAPGRHRVTFMVAFWDDVNVQSPQDNSWGANRLFPPSHPAHTWHQPLLAHEGHWEASQAVPVVIPPAVSVWVDVDEEDNRREGCNLDSLQVLPHYPLMFQGF